MVVENAKLKKMGMDACHPQGVRMEHKLLYFAKNTGTGSSLVL